MQKRSQTRVKIDLEPSGRKVFNCMSCGHTWRPYTDQPVQCANCRRKIIYEPTAEDLENERKENLENLERIDTPQVENDQGENLEELENLEYADPNHGKTPENELKNSPDTPITTQETPNLENEDGGGFGSIDNIDLDESPGPGNLGSIEDIDEIEGPDPDAPVLKMKTNPGFISTEEAKKQSTGNKGNSKAPDLLGMLGVKEDQIGGSIAGMLFNDPETSEKVAEDLTGFLSKHKGELGKGVTNNALDGALSELIPEEGGIMLDGAITVLKIIWLKMSENKRQTEKARIKKELKEMQLEEQLARERQAEAQAQAPEKPKPKTVTPEDPEEDPHLRRLFAIDLNVKEDGSRIDVNEETGQSFDDMDDEEDDDEIGILGIDGDSFSAGDPDNVQTNTSKPPEGQNNTVASIDDIEV